MATGVQWDACTPPLSPMMVSTSPALGGLLLLAAGMFQWTPLKSTCLTQCRSPWGSSQQRMARRGVGGPDGAPAWALLCQVLLGPHGPALGGRVMNLLWVAAIATFVIVERYCRWALVGRVAGACSCWQASCCSRSRWLT